MSIVSIRAALEVRLTSIAPSIQTAWENAPFSPTAGVAYQSVFLMPAAPENPTFGDGFYREIGLLQVSLFYPLQAGPKAAADRAELIRTTFKRGTSMVSGTVTVRVARTPEIGQGRVDGDRWHVPVRVVWFAGINP
jgi:hypothetical protein